MSFLPVTSRGPSRLRALLLVPALLLALAGCSLALDTESAQCSTDADCERFGTYPLCQEGVCVPSGLGPQGCFRGNASTEEQFLNQCTRAECVPFDNCARLGLCNASDPLPDLVPRPP
ncbi:hypothetical protein JY651_46305 [Pyxidicoccus parkwayensis]|uniref:Lipoprotein n=1 Tax=Pyxidicoccus parkwayensis TaxID=2813578 RepID=A0ABX7NU97_9BACT|nr:hypothetical protein [Pyxidicoccus parkwaysis]QSQ22454.1 hypothetical protein JY651_46305 [Pyxidicoccus parkwaysis]